MASRSAGSLCFQILAIYPEDEVDENVPVEDVSHEPRGYVGGVLKGLEPRCPIKDGEDFAVVSTSIRLVCMLWNGMHFFCGRRKLASFFVEWRRGRCHLRPQHNASRMGAYIGQFRCSTVHKLGA